jgi:hypothetical protein
MNQNLEVAKKLFAEGISVNAVASALGISWYYAKKFKKASPLLLALHLKQSRLQYRMGRRLRRCIGGRSRSP